MWNGIQQICLTNGKMDLDSYQLAKGELLWPCLKVTVFSLISMSFNTAHSEPPLYNLMLCASCHGECYTK